MVTDRELIRFGELEELTKVRQLTTEEAEEQEELRDKLLNDY